MSLAVRPLARVRSPLIVKPPLRLASIDRQIQALFSGAAQGGFYDPSDPRSVWGSSNDLATPGQPVCMVIDVSYNYATTTNYSGLDQFNFVAAGTTPPTTNSADTFLGQPCVSATFPVLAGGGFAVSRAQATPGAAVQAVSSGGAYVFEFEYAVSRPLEAGEGLFAYVTGTFVTQAISLNSSVPSEVWNKSGQLKGINVDGGGTVYPVVFASTVSGSPLTVYLRQVSSKTVLGNHLYQTTVAARPVYMESAGKRWLEFDGVDDRLSATFTWDATMDRISGFRSPPTNVNSHWIGATNNLGGLILSLGGNVRAYGSTEGSAATPVTASTDGVVVVRYTPTTESIRWKDNPLVTVADPSRAGGTGIVIGDSGHAGGAPAKVRWYGTIMRGGVAAMSDAEIALCRLWCATRAGVTL